MSPTEPADISLRNRTRDHVPLPDAARRVIRNQRGGQMELITQPFHGINKNRLPTQRSSAPALAQKLLPTAPSSEPRRLQPPTLQEMYNNWRALEEQVERIRRLPQFIKSNRRLCHACRIYQRKCDCFDYTQLEEVYQETNNRLRKAALHLVSFADDDQEQVEDSSHAPSSLGPSSTPAVQDPLSPSPGSWEWMGQPNGPALPVQNLPATLGPARGENRTTIPVSQQESAAIRANPAPASAPTSVKALAPTVAAKIPKADTRTTNRTVRDAQPPTHVQFEIRPVVIAKERLIGNSRIWRCQFTAASEASPPDMYGNDNSSTSTAPEFPCLREDDNLETIRRHYGREHGKHRYYQRPTLRLRCGHCDASAGDHQRASAACSECGTEQVVWLRELYALIEVQMPLPVTTTGDESKFGTQAVSSETLMVTSTAPPVLPLNSLPQQQMLNVPSPDNGYHPWMTSYGIGGPAPMMNAHLGGGFGAVLPTTPASPGTPMTPRTPLQTTPGGVSSSGRGGSGVNLAELTLFPQMAYGQPTSGVAVVSGGSSIAGSMLAVGDSTVAPYGEYMGVTHGGGMALGQPQGGVGQAMDDLMGEDGAMSPGTFFDF